MSDISEKTAPVEQGLAAGHAPDRTKLAALYEESRAMLGIGTKNYCEDGSNTWKRLLVYGSAALIGLLLREILKTAGLL